MRFLVLVLILQFVTLCVASADEPWPASGGTMLVAVQSEEAAADQDILEPEITIIQMEEQTLEEYRINGQLYMIKVTPSKGPPYFIVDSDGDGVLDTRRNDLAPDILVPQWILFRWK